MVLLVQASKQRLHGNRQNNILSTMQDIPSLGSEMQLTPCATRMSTR
jgi:hypothetical protein